jgi:hypothetical protein
MEPFKLTDSVVLGISLSGDRIEVSGRYRMTPEPRTEKAPVSHIRRIESQEAPTSTRKTLVWGVRRQTLIGIPAQGFYR